MKLLVSDYDNTMKITNFFNDYFIPDGTKEKINKFRENNIFMINTARPYDSIMYEIEKYKIPYDYVSSLNGAYMHDNQGNLVYKKDMVTFNEELLKEMFKYINGIECYRSGDTIMYYVISTRGLFSCKEMIAYLKEMKLEIMNRYYNTVHVVCPISNKIDTIKYLCEKDGICKKDVYCVGDDTNDIEMIKYYHGYAVSSLVPNFELLAASEKSVLSLNDALNDINKKI